MKKFIISIILLYCSNHIIAQDVIILKNGDELKAFVLEVLPDVIKYKKAENEKGPTYTENKGNVFMIKYKNGTKDVFNNQSLPTSTPVKTNPEEAKKENAILKLESNFKDFFANANPKVFKLQRFKKTNGVLRDYYGQSVYEVEFELTVQFLVDAWKVGNGLGGFWGNNFFVYLSEPKGYSVALEEVRYFPSGTVLTLGCKASLANSDNGYEFKEYKINTTKNLGIQQLETKISNNTNNIDKSINNSTNDIGIILHPTTNLINPTTRKNFTKTELYKIAYPYFKNKDYQKAADSFFLYTKIEPEDAYGFYMLGKCFEAVDEKMQRGLANEYYNKAIELGEKDIEKNKNILPNCYSYFVFYNFNILKDKNKALYYCDRFLSIEPSNKEVLEFKKLLKK